MWSTFLAAKDIWNIFLKTIDYVKNLEIKRIVEGGAGGGGDAIYVIIWRAAYESRYVTHP